MTQNDFQNTKLPDTPGVYRFIDSSGAILYIGRATSLRDRVRSYFGKDLIEERGPALVDMVTKSHHIEWTETMNVLEAIILEANLIKKFQPHYNTREKDNKSYYYIVITDEEFPRVFLERGRTLESPDGIKYGIKEKFGPYPHGPLIREGLKLLRKIFPYRSGKTKNKERDRFYEMIGLQQSTAEGIANEYRQLIDDLSKILRGQWEELMKDLEIRMNECSQKEQFEEALKYRNMIWSLGHMRDVTLVKAEQKERGVGSFRIEAFDVAHMSGKSMVGVMVVLENGEPQPSEYRKFHIRGIESANDPGALAQILARRFKHREWKFPNIIVCDGNEVQRSVGQEAVNTFRVDASVVSVVKDDKHKPKDILGEAWVIQEWKDAILLANAESHRYALSFHKTTRRRDFLK